MPQAAREKNQKQPKWLNELSDPNKGKTAWLKSRLQKRSESVIRIQNSLQDFRAEFYSSLTKSTLWHYFQLMDTILNYQNCGWKQGNKSSHSSRSQNYEPGCGKGGFHLEVLGENSWKLPASCGFLCAPWPGRTTLPSAHLFLPVVPFLCVSEASPLLLGILTSHWV